MDVVDMAGERRHTLIILSLLKKVCQNPKTKEEAVKTKQSLNVMLNMSQRLRTVMHGGEHFNTAFSVFVSRLFLTSRPNLFLITN